MILDKVWGMRIQPVRTSWMFTSTVARKVDARAAALIRTLRGVGYVLKALSPPAQRRMAHLAVGNRCLRLRNPAGLHLFHRFVADDIQRRSDAWLRERLKCWAMWPSRLR